jgi:hypothetical protein
MKTEKLIVILIGMSILFSSKAIAQVGVGITSYNIVLSGSIGDVRSYTVGIMNPSGYTTKVRVVFECIDCVSEVKIFGLKLFEKVEDPKQYFTFDKDVVTVPPYSTENNAAPVTIKFSPKLLIIKHLKFYTPEWLNFLVKVVNPKYDGSFQIPYPTLLIGKKELNGKLAAEVVSYNGATPGVMPSVAATMKVSAVGMPLGSLIFIILIILITIFLILRRVQRLKRKKK